MKNLFCFALTLLSIFAHAQDNSVPTAEDIDSFSYCPNESELKNLEILQGCCCLSQDSCLLKSTARGLKVIQTGYEMSVLKKKIIKGSCWEFANAVYNTAGFTNAKREVIFKGTKKGPFADIDMIQPGDWIFHINYSFYNVEHSAIFVCWKDYDKKIAITLSHVGQNLARSGIYGEFDLKSVYYITRPKD